ncbi:hypothetical protein ACFLRB_04895 [Acidobacteriota bacterium]
MRQAVVLIHGVGEQKPLDTLRRFVKSVFGHIEFRNKPDRMNESFELRRLQIPGSRTRPLTDFYEYYWAHHMRDTKLKMIIKWLVSILFKNPKNISKKLLPFFCIGWFLLLTTACVMFILCFIPAWSDWLKSHWKILGSGVLIVFDLLIAGFINRYIGDAARYLNPHPDNIEQRNRIRKEGIELLKSLHESKKYNRIIIVGHSLGSVIGYDLIRHYWATMPSPEKFSGKKQSELKKFKTEVRNLVNQNDKSIKERVEIFQQAQHRLWREFKSIGINWLISDFITLGAPLAHASTRLAYSADDFNRKKKECEYPTCPPYNSSEENIYFNHNLKIKNTPRTVRIPDHSSPFSCVRWSNLYFPHRKFVMGDFIAGPLSPVFGPGIKDIRVGLKGIKNSWLSHTNYWPEESGGSTRKDGFADPLITLRHVLRLETSRRSIPGDGIAGILLTDRNS